MCSVGDGAAVAENRRATSTSTAGERRRPAMKWIMARTLPASASGCRNLKATVTSKQNERYPSPSRSALCLHRQHDLHVRQRAELRSGDLVHSAKNAFGDVAQLADRGDDRALPAAPS